MIVGGVYEFVFWWIGCVFVDVCGGYGCGVGEGCVIVGVIEQYWVVGVYFGECVVYGVVLDCWFGWQCLFFLVLVVVVDLFFGLCFGDGLFDLFDDLFLVFGVVEVEDVFGVVEVQKVVVFFDEFGYDYMVVEFDDLG